jgi:hypothetical protein
MLLGVGVESRQWDLVEEVARKMEGTEQGEEMKVISSKGNLCLTMQLHASELQMPVLNSEPFRNSKGTNQLSTKASNTGGEKNREKREK